ncbi:MAG: hypothetical protein JO250_07350 [Armatimonadetes bacterium]|nr:hypothetical protein [Armatimonadota bacterium]
MRTARSAALPLAALLGLAALAAAPPARAATQTFNTGQSSFNGGLLINQGFYYNDGEHDATNDNHSTGQQTVNVGGTLITRDFNSFYTFDLSSLNLTNQIVTGATLTFNPLPNEAGISGSGATSENLGLFDVSTDAATLNASHLGGTPRPDIYTDLGSGTSYGTFTYPLSPTTPQTLTLDSAALTDITSHAGGFFSIGAALQGLPASGTELLFGGSDVGGISDAQTLTITTAPRASVPEASPMTFLGLGGLLLSGLFLRAFRRARQAA